MSESLTCGLYYACAGHWTLAAQQAGFTVDWHDAVFDPHNKILQDNFPNISLERTTTDIMMGSPPCVGFSTANQHYKKKEDRQYVLDFAREVNRLARYAFIMEMVQQIRKFPEYQQFRDILKDWHIQVLKLNVMDFGGAQTRKRLYIVGTREQIPEILLSKTGPTDVYQIIAQVKDVGKIFVPPPGAKGPFNSFVDKEKRDRGDFKGTRERTMTNPCQTITQMSDRMLWHPTEHRLTGYGEHAAIMGFPDWFKLPIQDKEAAKLIGPGVDVRATKTLLRQIRPYLSGLEQLTLLEA